MDDKQRSGLEEIARGLRRDVIEMTYAAQSGHPGASLALADILAVLYFHVASYDPQNPGQENRDRVILSKGHAAPILYATLAQAGFFSKKELGHLRSINAMLQGHPCVSIPGVDFTTGSLGMGLSAGCGMAMAAKMARNPARIYVMLGDGEHDEGQVWEAIMSSAHFGLDNLVAVVDRNFCQNDGKTEDVMKLQPLPEKWRAFNWNVVEIDGHDVGQIADAFEVVEHAKGRPSVIVANTVKGKGATYLYGKSYLHYLAPNAEQRESALKDLGFL